MTLPMLNGRMYISTSPALAAHIQRGSQTLDFEKLVIDFSPRMVGLSKEGCRILKNEEETHMVSSVMHEVIHPLLAANRMKDMAITQLRHFSDTINALQDGEQVDLFTFLTHEITAASMETLYGPQNPFAMHPELIKDFWDWERGLVGYIMSPYPPLTARKAHRGLENMVNGYIEYLEKGRQKLAYELIQRRQQKHADEGLSISDQARLEVGAGIAFNVNAGITIFWVLNNVFSNPSLLADVREEIRANALTSENSISFAAIKDGCPLLNSIYRETMRLMAPLSSARYVKDDTLIADTYLLRKGTVVQIAGSVLHYDSNVWGPDVHSFNPRRFYYTQNGTKTTSAEGSITESKSNSVHPAAYRSFGGGSSLCPGRHFAQMEILSLSAALVWGFDLEAPEGKSKVEWNPPKDEKKFPLATTKPLRTVDVRMVRRKGRENVKWVLGY